MEGLTLIVMERPMVYLVSLEVKILFIITGADMIVEMVIDNDTFKKYRKSYAS